MDLWYIITHASQNGNQSPLPGHICPRQQVYRRALEALADAHLTSLFFFQFVRRFVQACSVPAHRPFIILHHIDRASLRAAFFYFISRYPFVFDIYSTLVTLPSIVLSHGHRQLSVGAFCGAPITITTSSLSPVRPRLIRHITKIFSAFLQLSLGASHAFDLQPCCATSFVSPHLDHFIHYLRSSLICPSHVDRLLVYVGIYSMPLIFRHIK